MTPAKLALDGLPARPVAATLQLAAVSWLAWSCLLSSCQCWLSGWLQVLATASLRWLSTVDKLGETF